MAHSIPVWYKNTLCSVTPVGNLNNGPIICPLCQCLIEEGDPVASVQSNGKFFPNILVHTVCVEVLSPERSIEVLEQDYKRYTNLISRYTYWYYKY